MDRTHWWSSMWTRIDINRCLRRILTTSHKIPNGPDVPTHPWCVCWDAPNCLRCQFQTVALQHFAVFVRFVDLQHFKSSGSSTEVQLYQLLFTRTSRANTLHYYALHSWTCPRDMRYKPLVHRTCIWPLGQGLLVLEWGGLFKQEVDAVATDQPPKKGDNWSRKH